MRKVIRLTESDLHNIIRESVNKILKETLANNEHDEDNDWPEERILDRIDIEANMNDYPTIHESINKTLNEIEGQEPVNVNMQQQQQPQQQNNQLTPFQQGIQKWCQQAAAKIMNIEKATNAIWQTLQYQQRGQQYRR